MQFHGQEFVLTMGSDIPKDGMFLELRPVEGVSVAEVFYSDTTGEF